MDIREIRAKEKELQKLETKQQTTPLTKEDEQKVVAAIRRLTNEIKKMKKDREEELANNENVRALQEKIENERKMGGGPEEADR